MNIPHQSQNNPSILNTWKEIAAYLDRTVRTCQRWENELSLPIYRIEESDRASVYAYKEELDNWLKTRVKKNKLENLSFWQNKWILGPVSILILVVIGFIIFQSFSKHPQEKRSGNSNPVKYFISGSNVNFYDEDDNLLWDVKLQTTNAKDQFFDRAESQGKKLVDFADIDQDSRNEILMYSPDENVEKRVILFMDDNGTEINRFRFSPTQRYADTGLNYENLDVSHLGFYDVDDDKVPEILAIWIIQSRFLSSFVIWNVEGECLFHYNHTGQLHKFMGIDNGAGEKLIYIVGVNNLADGDAVIAVLNCDDLKSGTAPPYNIFGDASEYNKDPHIYIPINPTRASQKYYIRIRHNAVTRSMGLDWISPYIETFSSGMFQCSVPSVSEFRLFISFDSLFRPQSIVPNAAFEKIWNDMYEKNDVDMSLEEFICSPEKYILYWDGMNWVNTPTRCEKTQLLNEHN